MISSIRHFLLTHGDSCSSQLSVEGPRVMWWCFPRIDDEVTCWPQCGLSNEGLHGTQLSVGSAVSLAMVWSWIENSGSGKYWSVLSTHRDAAIQFQPIEWGVIQHSKDEVSHGRYECGYTLCGKWRSQIQSWTEAVSQTLLTINASFSLLALHRRKMEVILCPFKLTIILRHSKLVLASEDDLAAADELEKAKVL